MNHDGEMKALRKLTEELRDEPLPELDWESLERKTFDRISREEPLLLRPQRTSAARPVMALALAAAVVALLATFAGRAPDTSRDRSAALRPLDPSELPVRDANEALPTHLLTGVAAGSVVLAGELPLRFSLPGVAEWTLLPGTRVIVRSTGLPHVLELEQGTVLAEVEPRHDPRALVEAFVVEAGGTRVAVHGTVLSVERTGDRVTVEVTRGAVAVGPAGHRGETTGRLLVAPARASFHERTAELAEWLPQPAAVAVAAAEPPPAPLLDQPLAPVPQVSEPLALSPAPQLPRPGGLAAAPARELAPAPAPADAEPADPEPRPLSLGQAHGAMVACIKAAASTKAPNGVSVTIATTVSLQLDAEQRVSLVRFSPPLKPEVQQACASQLFGQRIDVVGSSVTFDVRIGAR